MKPRYPLALALVTSIAAACAGAVTGPTCTAITLQEQSRNADTVTMTTGLRYIEISEGSGAPVATCQPVSIHYVGYLGDGQEFDSSRGGPPVGFTPGVGELIPGLEQGVLGMQVGGSRRLIVPPALGYGSRAVRDEATRAIIIPANSTLIFDVEVLGTPP